MIRKFADIFDQASAIESIEQAYLADRLPHGLVFAGPVGVGKGTTAGALANLFLCEKPKGIEPCGKCEACRVFAAGNHPDYHVITKELIRYHDKTGKSKGIDLSIHVIRPELIEPASRKAVMGRGKVFIVEQAERMNAQAQNSILKTLEEPAGRTLIVLLTDSPDSLLATIRSRCQVVRFGALATATVERELRAGGVDAATATAAAKLAEGSLGTAQRWIEDGVIAAAGELHRQLDALVAGRAADNLPAWFKAAAEAYAAKQLDRDELASKDQANREGLGLYLRITANYFRARLLADNAPSHGADRQAHFSEPETPTRQSDLDRACAVIEAIVRAGDYLEANLNIALVFQQLAMELERQYV